MEEIYPVIEWIQREGKSCLKFTFKGILTEKAARDGVYRWKTAFRSKSNQKITLIWECHDMKSYENEARALWQDAMKDLKSQIDCIWLVTGSNLIRIGARVMSVFTGIEIKGVESESDISC